MSDIELKLGDKVTFTGTVKKKAADKWRGLITYEDAPLPGFEGYAWTKPVEESSTFHPRSEGFVVGKRYYASMERDREYGIWIPTWSHDTDEMNFLGFTGYLVAWHLSRKPVIVRLDQMTHINGVEL